MKKIIANFITILVISLLFQCCNSNRAPGYKSVNDSTGTKDSLVTSGINQSTDPLQLMRLADSLGSVKICVYLPETSDIPKEGLDFIQSLLVRILNQQGVCGTGGHPRFVLTPMVTQTNQDITSNAPTMYSNTYNVSFYIADAVDGDIFSSINMKIHGVGQSSLKAFMNALSGFNAQDEQFQNFIKQGTGRINAYFNNNCNAILKESNILATNLKFEQALTLLESVPTSNTCYDKIAESKMVIFKKSIDNDCEIALSHMKAELGNSNDPAAAGYNEPAMTWYSMISPKAKCFKEAEALYQKYTSKLNPKEKRDWEQKIQHYKDDLEKDKQNREFKSLQAQLSIDGNQELLDVYRKQYNYEKLPWIRKWIHLGSFDPFDGTK